MTGGERLEAIFNGEFVDSVPFALKGWRIPHGDEEAHLLKEGMCVLDSASVCRSMSPNVSSKTHSFTRNGEVYHQTVIRTPRGELSSVSRRVAANRTESTTWTMEWMFKGPKDYDAIEFMMRDRRYVPCYDTFLEAQAKASPAAYFKTGAPGIPLHTIMYNVMGLETFRIESAERRDRVLSLCDAMAENQREIYSIVAKSPAKLVQCGGNYASDVLGKQRFVDHVLPHWEEVGRILHEGGKRLGCHLDANNRLWAEEIGGSQLDWIEAFTPAPDTDMTLADAREMWPGKTLFINFPSSIHLENAAVIAETTKQLLRESAPGDRFVVGITENVPENRWRESFSTILKTLNEYGKLPVRND